MRRHSKPNCRSAPITNLHWVRQLDVEIQRKATQLAEQMFHKALKDGTIRVVRPSGDPSIFLPRMDMLEESNSCRTLAIFELPGVKSDEITVNVHNGIMYVRGERKRRTPQEYTTSGPFIKEECSQTTGCVNYTAQELRYGLFSRDVPLPPGVKEDEVVASLKDGLLIVTLQPRPIKHEPDTPFVHDKPDAM